ncbi:MAG: ABC transporter substrate-binding protein [Ruminiclostridium sp.]|nr:ABC transporter substrate-binding protein [Ruminiclostridium sp.]
MKKVFALMLSLVIVFTLCACGGSTTEEVPEDTAFEGTTIRIGGLQGPTSMGMVKMLSDSEAGETVNSYEFTMAGSADELTPKLLQGELDILAVPVNLGSILYNNSDGAVQMLAANVLGVLYIVEKGGDTVSDWESLKGQTIYATGKGSTPEYALNYLLTQYGLDPATDVTVEWKSEPTEIVAQMAAQDHAVALLPQPFVTVAQGKFPDMKVVMGLSDQWDALDNGSQFITAGLIVRSEFAQENPEAVAAFLEEYAASTQFINENVAEGAQLVGEYGIVDAAVAEKAIPYCNIVCITGNEMVEMTTGYFQTLFDQNPKSMGGQMPGEDFFYIAE